MPGSPGSVPRCRLSGSPQRLSAPASAKPGADARFSCLAAKVSENTMRRQILDELGALTHAPLSTFPG